MDRLPKAGELIPDILSCLATMPSGNAALLQKVASRHGIDQEDYAVPFGSRFDMALNFLVKSGFVGREKRRVPLHLTKSGRHLLKRLPDIDLDSISEAVDPGERLLGKERDRSLSGKDVDELSRTESVQDMSRKIATRLTSRLKDMPIDKVYALWTNAMKSQQDSRPEIQIASHLVIQAVTAERERRATNRLPSTKAAFRWPRTEAVSGQRGLAMEAAADLGILARMGYRVGQARGVPIEERRNILVRVFEGALPTSPEAYVRLWGDPNSPKRLKKMASTIAALARNGRRRSNISIQGAVDEWEEDLAYLRERFYEGRYDGGFNWPSSTRLASDDLDADEAQKMLPAH